MSDEDQLVDLEALNQAVIPSEVSVRNLAKREIDVRLAPFGVAINTINGPEIIEPGSFRGTEPSKVLLMGLEHEVHLGLGQDGRVVPTRRPTGKALSIEEREDGAYGTFRVASTPTGDEILALASEGIVGGVSIEMGREAKVRIENRNGRRTNVVTFADLRAASPTYQPAYAEARVLAVRSQKEDAPVAAEDKAPEAGATAADEGQTEPVAAPVQARSTADTALIEQMAAAFNKPVEKLLDRIEKLEERGRSGFVPQAAAAAKEAPPKGDWLKVVLNMMAGERIAEGSPQYRIVADFITTDNAGVVPDTYSSELIGVIDTRRPFLSSTRRIPVPATGLNLVVPKITQRPTTAVQSAEKTELSSTKSIITTEQFAMVTIGGYGDLSLQLLRRADRSFLDLYLELLSEAYAIDAEDEATDALIEAINDGGPEPATGLDPEDLNLGAAFEASFSATRRPPDTIWLSTGALAAFIDAKSDGTNAPLYPGATAAVTAGRGAEGTISGLRPVHVPALDNKGAYAIVGPSSGFAWAEDGTFTIQVDVPAKAGRDVALVGMMWFAPYYPAAFSLFNVAS